MNHTTHTSCVMSDTDSFYIRICGCGVVHLCFGATTLNATPQVVIAITETLKDVAAEIQRRKQSELAQLSVNPLLETANNLIQGHFPKKS